MSQDLDPRMVCTCTADGRTEAEARIEQVRQRLRADDRLVNAVLRSLLPTHRVASVEVFADQWFALVATLRYGSRVLVSADEREHGVAPVWERVAQPQAES